MRLSQRVHTTGSAADVWTVLGEPRRWPCFDVLLARVHGAPGPVEEGQRLVAVTRGLPLRVPVDVVRVVPRKAVQLRINAAPGVREELEYILIPLTRGGTQVSVTIDLDGPMARAGLVGAWAVSAMNARLLARCAARARRARLIEASGAA